jgi:sigma-B regulation protein RsbU (phosphoserine phosphatase)
MTFVMALAVQQPEKSESSASIPTILIVDDTPVNVAVLQGILRAEGFCTLIARDGPSARALLQRETADLILLDVMMPGESGFETCSHLKSNPATSGIPIIFLSALSDVESKVAGLRAGGVDYVVKPFHGDEVLARVRVHLRIRDTNRMLIEKHRRNVEDLRNAQQAILVRPEDCPEARFSVYYQPLEETSGDFYDVFPIGPDAVCYFIADVSGHGASAAFLTSAIKALLRQYSGPLYSPEDTLRGVDSVMRQMLGEEQYLTACFARLNRRSKRLTVVNAGHLPLIVVRASGGVETVEMDSDPLGMFSSAVLQRKDLALAAGDRFFLYTDGLVEGAPGAPRQAGIARLSEACVANRAAPLREAADVIARASQVGQPKPEDDLLLMAIEVGA